MYICKNCGKANDFEFTLDLIIENDGTLHGHFPFDCNDTSYKKVKCNCCGYESEKINDIAKEKGQS